MNQYMTIPARLPGRNEVDRANRANRYAGAKLKKETQEEICWAIRAAGLQPVRLPCVICCTFEETNRRRDVDNVESAVKFILDALKACGIIRDDGPAFVVGAPTFTRYTDAGNRVLVTIIEDASEDAIRARLRAGEEAICRE